MPGTSIAYRRTGNPDRDAFEARTGELLHDERYVGETISESDRSMVGRTGYPEYPVRTVEVDGHTVVVEGMVYDRDEAEFREDLSELVGRVAADEGYTEFLAEWLPTVDGEFLLTVLDGENDRVVAVTDYLGRLPVYHATSADELLVSREMRFVVDGLADPTFDRLAVAQYLLFGYTLGERTFVEEVRRVPPAAVITMSGDGIDVEQVCEQEYGRDAHADRSMGANARRLADLFDEACRNRSAATGPSLVSLSGGLDSRAILASYAEQGLPHVAATMSHPAVPDNEVDIAAELAATYGTDWYRYDVDRSDARVLERQVKTRNGRDPLSISHLTEFFDEILADHGAMPHLVGAGGDKALPDLTPARSLADTEDLVDYLIESYGEFGLDEAAELAGVRSAALHGSVRAHVETYPEASPEARYVHFVVHERGMSWIFEAEDTNRYYFWGTSPFWSVPFFRYAMNCPASQKRCYRLYGRFLEALSPTSVEIDNANFGAPPGSLSHTLRAFGYETLRRYPGVFDRLKPTIKRVIGSDNGATVREDVVACLERQLENDTLDDALSVADLERRVLSEPTNYTPRQLYGLFTVASYVDDVTAERSVLEGLATKQRLLESSSEALDEADRETLKAVPDLTLG